jgi:putative FmdB family regulatory protein
MPLYDYDCQGCGEQKDVWAEIEEVALSCPHCGYPMERLISPTSIIPDIEPYVDEHMNEPGSTENVVVKSRRHKRQLLKDRGLVEVGDHRTGKKWF